MPQALLLTPCSPTSAFSLFSSDPNKEARLSRYSVKEEDVLDKLVRS
jgi:hypothetical protein